MDSVVTTCPLDCPDTCSVTVTTDGGTIVSIGAGPENPFTAGWICAKVRKSAARVYAPERVMTPLVRVGPKGSAEFRPASWDEAAGLVSDRVRLTLAASGPGAVAAYTYNSSGGVLAAGGLTERLFRTLGVAEVEHTICAATVGAAWDSVYGDMLSADSSDIVHSRFIVVWGANPTVSNSHLVPLVNEAVSAGARLVVIDPRRTPLAARADRHLAVRPGTDVALALAMIAVAERDGLIDHDFVASRTSGLAQLLAAARPWTPDRAGEVCGLDASEIVALTHDWSTARPAMLRIGWGQERNANGGAACRAILALPAVLGQFGARGSGVLSSLSGARPVALRRLDPEPPGGFPVRRSVPMHQLGRWLNDADEAIEVLIVQGANPLVTCPDERAVRRGLLRDDLFTVVHEQVLTDTARYADVVFPAVTHYETTDLAGSYGTFTLQPVEPVIAAVGESRTNDEFAAALAVRLGLPVSAFVVDAEAQRRAAVTDDGGLGPRLLRSSTIQFVDTSPDGPVRLVDPVVGAPRYVPLAASEPLVLLTPASARTINSMFGEFQSPDPVIRVHPVDAAARGLVGGERVAVHNSLGRIEVRCTVDGDLRPGVAVMPKGVWLDNYSGGEGVNSLITDEADELAFGACFNDARVEVTRLD